MVLNDGKGSLGNGRGIGKRKKRKKNKDREDERGREKEPERDGRRPVADGQAEESRRSCGLEKQAPSPRVDCPSPTVWIQSPGPVLPVHQPA